MRFTNRTPESHFHSFYFLETVYVGLFSNININDVNVEFFLCVRSYTKYFVYSLYHLIIILTLRGTMPGAPGQSRISRLGGSCVFSCLTCDGVSFLGEHSDIAHLSLGGVLESGLRHEFAREFMTKKESKSIRCSSYNLTLFYHVMKIFVNLLLSPK